MPHWPSHGQIVTTCILYRADEVQSKRPAMENNIHRPCDDGLIGPAVAGCRADFDFTLSFEAYFFTIVPAAMLLLAAPARVFWLRRKPVIVLGTVLRLAKITAIAMLAALQLVLIILWTTTLRADIAHKSVLAASVLSLAAALLLLPLSYLEHAKSLRPSLLISAYLFLSLLLDLAMLRSLWLSSTLIPVRDPTAAVFSAAFALKFSVLILEAWAKRRFFRAEFRRTGPEESTGLFGQVLLWWANPLIWTGSISLLRPADLYPVTPDMRSEHLLARFWEVWTRRRPGGKHPLPKALLRAFWWQALAPVPARAALVAFTLCQPLLLNRVLGFLDDASGTQNINVGKGLVGATAIIYIGMAVSAAVYWHRFYRFLVMTRGALTTSIYQMATRLRIDSGRNAKIVTLMSTDCEQVVRGLIDLHELWAAVVQIAIAIWLVEIQLGVACVAPVAMSCIALGLAWGTAKFVPRYQVKWLDKVQARIAMTSSVLSSMKAIRISNLGLKASRAMVTARKDELDGARKFRWLRIFGHTAGYTPQLLTPIITFAIFIGVAKSSDAGLDPARMFTAVSLLLLIADSLFKLFLGFTMLLQSLNCLKRVEEFILTPLPQDGRITNMQDGQAIIVQNGSFGWSETEPPCVKNLSFAIRKGEIVILLGPVASGKSTLLHALLGETPLMEGSVAVSDKEIAFCGQSPWLMNASVRENITGFMPYDAGFYRTVITACDLVQDLLSLPQRDGTVVGSKGFALSAGQRQRIALARAVYARKPITVLDGVLSQVDATTQLRIMHRLLGPDGILRTLETTVVMSMSSPRSLFYAGKVLVLGEGVVLLQQGSPEALGSTCDAVVNAPERPEDVYEQSAPEKNDSLELAILKSPPESSGESRPATDAKHQEGKASENESKAAKKARQSLDWSVYRYYFASMRWRTIVMFAVFQIILAFLMSFPYVWLGWWSDDSTSKTFPNDETSYYMGIYALLQVLGCVATGAVAWWTSAVLGVESGFRLHNTLVETVMTSTLKLFSATDSGSILNRFTQDIQLADLSLPLALQIVVTNSLICIAQAGLIASATGWVALSYPFLLALFYGVTVYYTRTSRQLRYLDLENKAPVYAQFLETLDGIVSIRAMGWTHGCFAKSYRLVDNSQQPYYLMYIIQKWLSLVLDMAVAGLATLLIGLGVALRGHVGSSAMGVALTQVVSFTGYLKMMVLFLAQMQTSMAAVERIRDFSQQTEREEDAGDEAKVPEMLPGWPSQGGIEIEGLSARYSPESDLILQDVTLSIPPGSKICICGRTGSGKSSLALALLRLLDPCSGSIRLDGTDMSTVPRSLVRSRIAGVAEEPFLLPGGATVRENMDPYGSHADAEIVRALVDAGDLCATLQARAGGSGGGKVGEDKDNKAGKDDKEISGKEEGTTALDAPLDRDTLSHGQRQLFAMARALLRNARVLVLDEVASSLDARSEERLHEVVEERLRGTTVVWVAHRLHFARTFDRVVVMDKGRVVEFDEPAKLLADKGSAFRVLVDAHGEISGTED